MAYGCPCTCIRAVANRSGLYTDHFFVLLKKNGSLCCLSSMAHLGGYTSFAVLWCGGVLHAHFSCTHLSNTHHSVQQQQQKAYIFPLQAPHPLPWLLLCGLSVVQLIDCLPYNNTHFTVCCYGCRCSCSG